MITSLLATVALVLAGGSGEGSGEGAALCPIGLYSNAQCCAVNVLGVAALDCGARKSLVRLSNERDRLSILLYLQPLPPLTPRTSSSQPVPSRARRLCAVLFQWYVNFILYWLTLY